ncbi:MAG: Trk system potassium transporter TrkA [Oscillospiraceae bacterium]|nr:Trk system potassium transporter TrkA [Oscillospiraceae bacterium]
MKIIIAGDGKVGATLTKQLSEQGYDITLIDSNQSVLETSVELYDIMAIKGNCATTDVLNSADVKGADLLIAATSTDEINLLCCMTAHKLNPKIHTIARIRNPEYRDQIFDMRDVFGLSLIVNPERQAAIEIERLLQLPGFLKRDSFANGRVEIVELKVNAQSKLKDVSLNDLYKIVKCKVLVCAVMRKKEVIIPGGDFVMRENDRIFVTAQSENLSTLLKNLGIISKKVRRVILAGGGKISYYLAQRLETTNIAVTLIENDYNRCRELAALLPKTDIIHGDASDRQLLIQAGLSECEALVTLTGIDELNIMISLYGSNCGVPQIITKLGRVEESGIIDTLPIGSMICPKKLCCDQIERYVRAMENQTGAAVAVHHFADGNAEAMEFRVDSKALNCDTPLKDLRLKKHVLLVSINKRGRTEIPNGDSFFSQGDTIIVVSGGDVVIRQLNDIFE